MGAFAAVVPVVRDVVLSQFKRAASARHPPIGLVDDDFRLFFGLDIFHIFGFEELQHGWTCFFLLFYIIAESRACVYLTFGKPDFIHPLDIGGQQGAVHPFGLFLFQFQEIHIQLQAHRRGELEGIRLFHRPLYPGDARNGAFKVSERDKQAVIIRQVLQIAFGRGRVVEVIQHAQMLLVRHGHGVQPIGLRGFAAHQLQDEIRFPRFGQGRPRGARLLLFPGGEGIFDTCQRIRRRRQKAVGHEAVRLHTHKAVRPRARNGIRLHAHKAVRRLLRLRPRSRQQQQTYPIKPIPLLLHNVS